MTSHFCKIKNLLPQLAKRDKCDNQVFSGDRAVRIFRQLRLIRTYMSPLGQVQRPAARRSGDQGCKAGGGSWTGAPPHLGWDREEAA